jgi:hypothetical protein
MRSSKFKITIFIESITTRKEKAELPLHCRACIPIGNEDIPLAAVSKSSVISKF